LNHVTYIEYIYWSDMCRLKPKLVESILQFHRTNLLQQHKHNKMVVLRIIGFFIHLMAIF